MNKKSAERLRTARIDRGFSSASEAASDFGWSVSTYTSHENGTRGLRRDTAEKYSKAFGVSAAYLLGIAEKAMIPVPTDRVEVVGAAETGVWRDKRIDNRSARKQTIPIPNRYGGAMRHAVRIADASIDNYIESGGYAIFRISSKNLLKSKDLSHGDFVVVERVYGDLKELTVKRVEMSRSGPVTLSSYSKDKSQIEKLFPDAPPEGETINVLGKVVGRYYDDE